MSGGTWGQVVARAAMLAAQLREMEMAISQQNASVNRQHADQGSSRPKGDGQSNGGVWIAPNAMPPFGPGQDQVVMSVGTHNFLPFPAGSCLQPTNVMQPAIVPSILSGVADCTDESTVRKRSATDAPFIPGLIPMVFKKGSYHKAGTPTLNHSIVNQDDSVDFRWTALSSDRSCEYHSSRT
jgi:hypothetical protein